MKLKYIDITSVKILTLSVLGLIAIPYWFYTGGDALTLISILCLSKFLQTCGTIGYHRWLCHNSFKPNLLGKYLMLVGMILNSVGRPLHVVVAHRLHHAHPDQDADPHSPKHNGFWKLWLGRFKVTSGIPNVKDFFRNREAVFVSKHYWSLWWAINLTIAAIDLPTALVFCPVNFLVGWTGSTYINYHGHNASDKQNLKPTNLHWLFQFLALGEELHGNHHQSPSSYHFDGNDRTDLSRRLIERLLMQQTMPMA
jgi:stearoyl-CoA desaturase (delta-9 desaturase)